VLCWHVAVLSLAHSRQQAQLQEDVFLLSVMLTCHAVFVLCIRLVRNYRCTCRRTCPASRDANLPCCAVYLPALSLQVYLQDNPFLHNSFNLLLRYVVSPPCLHRCPCRTTRSCTTCVTSNLLLLSLTCCAAWLSA
jgi:hypothetical protein